MLQAEIKERAEGHHHHGSEGDADEHGADDHDHAAPGAMADSTGANPAAACTTCPYLTIWENWGTIE